MNKQPKPGFKPGEEPLNYQPPEAHFGYASGPEVQTQISRRQRRGRIMYLALASATIVAILALTALLYTIVNTSFGLVAIEYENEPDKLVLDLQKEVLLGDEETVSSEDDNELVAGIIDDPYAVGFFGYSYYQNNRDNLRIVSIDNVEANAGTVESGEYSLARPLFIYSTQEIMAENPAVNAFINYFLTHVNEEIDDVGYFSLSQERLGEAQDLWKSANELDVPGWAVVEPDGIGGDMQMAGSSTVNPLTQRMLEGFSAGGYTGTATNESIGSGAGFRRFCVEAETDISNASRAIKPGEFAACRSNQRLPLEFQVGSDAIAVTVSAQNDFLTNVTTEELRQIFTTADNWSDVNPQWPDEKIKRWIPGADSGTLDFFEETVFPVELQDLEKPLLVGILADHISTGLGRRLESEQRFFEDELVYFTAEEWADMCSRVEPAAGCTLPARTQENVLLLVEERVVEPKYVAVWPLVDSIFRRSEIEEEVFITYPNAELKFHSWINPRFLSSPQSSSPELAGVRTALLGSLWVILITIVFSFPIGVGAAIYLEEYATDTPINRIIQTNINNLAGVPSIIYGMLGLAVFVRVFEPITSGALLGYADPTTANGRTIVSAGLTLGLLILPIIIISGQEAIRAVPNSMRQAGMALGATKWQTIWHHVLPSALPGILTGTILAVSRALGETAPLVVVGASTFITVDPNSPFSKFTTLPAQIYQWTSRPQAEFQNLAASAIIVLLVLLLTLNATAIFLRNRFARRAQ